MGVKPNRQGWCGPQAQPRTRPGLIDLPEGEGSVFPLTAKGVWLAQIPLVPGMPGCAKARPHLFLGKDTLPPNPAPIRWRTNFVTGKSLKMGMISIRTIRNEATRSISAV